MQVSTQQRSSCLVQKEQKSQPVVHCLSVSISLCSSVALAIYYHIKNRQEKFEISSQISLAGVVSLLPLCPVFYLLTFSQGQTSNRMGFVLGLLYCWPVVSQLGNTHINEYLGIMSTFNSITATFLFMVISQQISFFLGHRKIISPQPAVSQFQTFIGIIAT